MLKKSDRPGAATPLDAVFSEHGQLSRKIPGYRVRPQQLDMALRVLHAIRENTTLVCEAGTGTGKTVAYLVPALLSGGKVIISTGTKTLQDQLYRRDLPTVREALEIPLTAALLKGRGNYVCHQHLERYLVEGLLPSRDDVAHLHRIARFARVTTSGDKSECADVPEDAAAWNFATSTRENCLGQKCPRYSDCFVMLARREALAADVVVVNHHLFFADVMLKDEGMAELLPACNTVIFDEAHQLPETATLFFGESVSTGQLLEFARDLKSEALIGAKDAPELGRRADALEKAARDMRLAAPEGNSRQPAASLIKRGEFAVALAAAQSALEAMADALDPLKERSEGLARCAERCRETLEKIDRWNDADRDDLVRWAEIYSRGLQLNSTPLSVAEIFRRQMEGHPRAWIFTSATLAVDGDFSHYRRDLGLDEGDTACWESPFDYQRNALLYVPRNLPDPSSADHTRAVVAAAMPAIRASRGRAFLLFTTLRGMRLAHQLLQEQFAIEELPYPLLLQGEGSRSELLERFRQVGNAVLIGSASFWEGVDVRGEALSLVVIDKLPFAPPDDPVLAARLEQINREGRNAFMEYQLPQAVLALKQGAGRLIRDESDRGVLMICDPRLFSKSYGRRILPSLPPMKLVREPGPVIEFFASSPASAQLSPS